MTSTIQAMEDEAKPLHNKVEQYEKVASEIFFGDTPQEFRYQEYFIGTVNDKDRKWLEQARHVGEDWSKDPNKKIGCVMVDEDGNHLTQGYNGFIRGHADSPEDYADRETKYKHIIHAETNAIYNAARQGVRLMGATAYVYGLPPCNECAKAMVQAGIKRVVAMADSSAFQGHWAESCSLALETLEDAGVQVDIMKFEHYEDVTL